MGRLNVIMLAGGMRASAFRRQLGIPTLRLPVGHGSTLLDVWMEALAPLAEEVAIRIVVNWEMDVEQIQNLLNHRTQPRNETQLQIEVIKDPAPWRGTGGLLRDVTAELPQEALVMVVESSCLPPTDLDSMLQKMDNSISGVVGSTKNHEPAGVYVFRRCTFAAIPHEGFCDLKEQFLPSLYRQGTYLLSAEVCQRVTRVRDRNGYLMAVRDRLSRNGSNHVTHHQGDAPRIASSARLLGSNLIEADTRIEEGAIVHDSVLMRGSVIRRGAMISRSIIASRVEVGPAGIVRNTIKSHRDALTMEKYSQSVGVRQTQQLVNAKGQTLG